MQFCVFEITAKTKVCHRTIGTPSIGPCVGSNCMAWRWVETNIADDDGNLTVKSGDTHGYCGLAGPEWRR